MSKLVSSPVHILALMNRKKLINHYRSVINYLIANGIDTSIRMKNVNNHGVDRILTELYGLYYNYHKFFESSGLQPDQYRKEHIEMMGLEQLGRIARKLGFINISRINMNRVYLKQLILSKNLSIYTDDIKIMSKPMYKILPNETYEYDIKCINCDQPAVWCIRPKEPEFCNIHKPSDEPTYSVSYYCIVNGCYSKARYPKDKYPTKAYCKHHDLKIDTKKANSPNIKNNSNNRDNSIDKDTEDIGDIDLIPSELTVEEKMKLLPVKCHCTKSNGKFIIRFGYNNIPEFCECCRPTKSKNGEVTKRVYRRCIDCHDVEPSFGRFKKLSINPKTGTITTIGEKLYCGTCCKKHEGCIPLKNYICTICIKRKAYFKNKYCNLCKSKLGLKIKSTRNPCKFIDPTTNKQCDTNACYGLEGEPPSRCEPHARDDMIPRNYSKKCMCGEKKQPSYGLPGGKPECCKKCKTNNMIQLKKLNCDVKGCNKIPIFGKIHDDKPSKCKIHMEEDMVDIVNKKCDKCTSQPRYGLYGFGRTHCSIHKTDEMVEMTRKKCKKCKRMATFGYDRKEPKRCLLHMKRDMIDVLNIRCQKCNITLVRSINTICARCDPENSHIPKKELEIVDYLKETFNKFLTDTKIKYTYRHNKGANCMSRPDLYYEFDDHVIVVEIDEYQHKKYKCNIDNYRGDNMRMLQINKFCKKNCVFIRYNPDTYRVANRIQNVNSDDRKLILLNLLKRVYNKKYKHNLLVYRLFFDNETGDVKTKYTLKMENYLEDF